MKGEDALLYTCQTESVTLLVCLVLDTHKYRQGSFFSRVLIILVLIGLFSILLILAHVGMSSPLSTAVHVTANSTVVLWRLQTDM